MTTHHLTQHDATLTCDVCTWRAVLTTDNRIIQTASGDPGHDHIGQAQALRDQQLALRNAHIEQRMDHLRKQYAERAVLPCGGVLGLKQLQRLYRHVMSEHGL